MPFIWNISPLSEIETKFREKCIIPSDINEHLPTLRRYGNECSHITECGVRSVVSSYAFACALKGKQNNKLIQVDLDWHPNLGRFADECSLENIHTTFYKESDLTCPIEKTELLFIDTWHIYGHLKRELARWNPYVSKYIIMHDTTVDEIYGETIRMNGNAEIESKNSGIPIEEINKGLWPAIEEFLNDHTEWKMRERFTNNNGLTILERITNDNLN